MTDKGEENGGLSDDDTVGQFIKESEKKKTPRPTPSKPEKSGDE